MKKVTLIFAIFFYGSTFYCSDNIDSLFIKQLSNFEFKLEQIEDQIKLIESNNDSFFINTNKFFSEEMDEISKRTLIIDSKIQEILKTINHLDSINKSQDIQNEYLTHELNSFTDSLLIVNSNIVRFKTKTQNQIKDVNFKIGRNTIYWLIVLFLIVLVIILLFLLIKKKISKTNKNLIDQIDSSKKFINNESIKLDSKLIEIMENQIREVKYEKKDITGIDHSLPIQVGLEIYRMRRRIKFMPEDTKGINALSNALERLEDEFKSNGYDIVDLLNKPYNDGLTVEANFFPSNELKAGEKIITKVIKPQINYNGKLVFQSKIEVTEGV